MTASNPPIMTRRRLIATTATIGAASAAGIVTPGAMTDASAADGADGPGDPRSGGLVDAVLAALRKHRLVAIGEGGTHGLQEHHDALTMLLTDPRLPELVDDVVVEFGNALYQATMDRFMAGLPVDNVDLRPVWRNTTQSPLGTWDMPVFEQMYRTIRAVNGGLPPNERIRVLLGEPPIDWSKITTLDELNAFRVQRDSNAASVVQGEVLKKGRRALICYGAAHVLHWTSQRPMPPSGLVARIEQQTDERVYTFATLTPMSGDPGGLGERLSKYPRRTAISTAGTWLGDFDAGLVFPAAFRGADGQPTNLMCGIPLGSVLDAGLYVGQPDQLTVSRENPAVYLDSAYWAELQRRNGLQGGMVDLDSYRQEQSTRFTPQTIPPSLRCSS
jgi:hypothetical protein